jgi:nucleotide-binding universal stress UspA family protein
VRRAAGESDSVERKESAVFKTIVWATDGSELADRALPIVTGIARAHRSKIVAIHADEILVGRLGGGPMLADEPEIVEKIERQVEDLRRAGFVAELKVIRGIDGVATMIAHAADESGASLIVVGTHSHGAFASAVLGSVARGLLHEAACPVLAVPPVRVREPALV